MNAKTPPPSTRHVIRPANRKDLPLLANVEQAAATIFPPGSIPDEIRGDAVPLSTLEEALEQNALWVAVAEDGSLAGFCLLCFIDGLALLAEVDVRPEHGRQGIGRKLIRRAAERAVQGGYPALYLTTFAHIPWNAPFYEHLGFVCLRAEETPPALTSILAAERAHGLVQRVGMRLDI